MIEQTSMRGLRVLLIDDTTHNVEIVARSLSQQGAEVFHAASCKDAVQIIREVRPDVTLFNPSIGEAGGMEVLKGVGHAA